MLRGLLGRGVGVAVAALQRVVADLLDEGGDDGRRGRVPDAQVGVTLGILAAARLGGVPRAGGVAVSLAERGVGLQAVAAEAGVAVFNAREAVVVLEAILLADVECHFPRRRFSHARESIGRGLVGAAKVCPAIHDLAGSWREACWGCGAGAGRQFYRA